MSPHILFPPILLFPPLFPFPSLFHFPSLLPPLLTLPPHFILLLLPCFVLPPSCPSYLAVSSLPFFSSSLPFSSSSSSLSPPPPSLSPPPPPPSVSPPPLPLGVPREDNPIRCLYECLDNVGRRDLAENIRRKVNEMNPALADAKSGKCTLM